MEYIKEVLQIIEVNIKDIPLRKHGLEEKFNVSMSKLEQDFKKTCGITLRKHLIREKLKEAKRIKTLVPGKIAFEITSEIGWSLSEKSFLRNYKDYFGVAFSESPYLRGDYDDGNLDPESLWSLGKTKKNLDEVLFRTLLLTGSLKLSFSCLFYREYSMDVRHTFFQFHFIPVDEEMIFSVSYDPEIPRELEVCLRIKDQIHPNCFYEPNSTKAYLQLFRNLTINNVIKPPINIESSISNWEEIVLGEGSITSEWFGSYPVLTCNNDIEPRINKESEVFIASHIRYLALCTDMDNDIRQGLARDFDIEYDPLIEFMYAIRKEEYASALQIFEDLLRLSEQDRRISAKSLDLILQIADCPYLDNIDLEDYAFEYGVDFVQNIADSVSLERLPQIAIRFSQLVRADTFDNCDRNNTINLLKELVAAEQD